MRRKIILIMLHKFGIICWNHTVLRFPDVLDLGQHHDFRPIIKIIECENLLQFVVKSVPVKTVGE